MGARASTPKPVIIKTETITTNIPTIKAETIPTIENPPADATIVMMQKDLDDQMKRVGTTKPTEKQLLDAYRVMFFAAMGADKGTKKFGIFENVGAKVQQSPIFKTIQIEDGTDDGVSLVVMKDMHNWLKQFTKPKVETFVGGFNMTSMSSNIVRIAIMTFVFYFIMTNHKKIITNIKKFIR